MKDFGFVKVAAAIPSVRVADCEYNVEQTLLMMRKADEQHVEIVVFPELNITAYTCQDLFRQNILIHAAEQGVSRLMEESRTMDIIAIVGTPVVVGDLLLDA